MAKCIRGEIRLDAKSMGQASDLFCILLTAGYVLETKIVEDFSNNFAGQKGQIVFTIMTEEE